MDKIYTKGGVLIKPYANLACGNDYKPDAINIDKSKESMADLLVDLLEPNWELPDNCFTRVELQHFMEHVPREKLHQFMRELYRVCADDCMVYITSPHWSSDNFHTDPTHCLPISLRTFDFFDQTKPLGENGALYGWNDVAFNVMQAKLIKNPPNGPDVEHVLKVNKSISS